MNVEMANRLVELRKKHGLSQEELADKLSISRQAVSKWERAESAPDTDNLIALSKLYSTSIDKMLNIYETTETVDRNAVIKVSDSEADDYLRMYKRGGFILGLGIICVFLAVITLLSIIEYVKIESLGLTLFFVILATAVGIILYAVFPLSRFEYIERTKKLIELTKIKQADITEKYKKFSPKFIRLLITAIGLILLSVILPIVFRNILATVSMLGIIGVATFIIITISFEYSVYEKLLGVEKRRV